jgi:hypothetical protein
MSLRDLELLEAIRRDDLAYVLTTRYEKPLEGLLSDDTPSMLTYVPSPMMVAAFLGSTKSFDFFLRTGRIDYRDHYGVLFSFFVIASTLLLPAEICQFSLHFCLYLGHLKFKMNWGIRHCTILRNMRGGR